MKLELTTKAGDTIDLYLNGELKATIHAGEVRDRDSLQAEVRLAESCVRNLPDILLAVAKEAEACWTIKDETLKTPQKRTEGWLQGFRDGWNDETEPSGMPGVPPFDTVTSPANARGYALGNTLFRHLLHVTRLRAEVRGLSINQEEAVAITRGLKQYGAELP